MRISDWSSDVCSSDLLPIDFDYYAAARMVDEIDAFWSSGAVCHPLVTTSLRDIVAKARVSGDWAAARALQARLGTTAAPLFPHGSFKEFSTYKDRKSTSLNSSHYCVNRMPPSA